MFTILLYNKGYDKVYKQPDEEVHSSGASVLVELGYATLLAYRCMCSPTQILSEPCAGIGNLM